MPNNLNISYTAVFPGDLKGRQVPPSVGVFEESTPVFET